MRYDPVITVRCEKCGYEMDYDLCALAGDGQWDERYLDDDMERDGWTWDEENDYCSTCSDEKEDLETEEENERE